MDFIKNIDNDFDVHFYIHYEKIRVTDLLKILYKKIFINCGENFIVRRISDASNFEELPDSSLSSIPIFYRYALILLMGMIFGTLLYKYCVD